MGLTVAEAKKLGIWEKISEADKRRIIAAQKKSVSKKKGERNLQQELYDSVVALIPTARWEEPNLIPGRKFRADIFIPPNMVVECDGWRHHGMSKEGFHSGLERQNQFVKAGFIVLRYSAMQIMRGKEKIVSEVYSTYKESCSDLSGAEI